MAPAASGTEPPVVDADGLVRQLAGRRVVDGVSLAIGAHEVVCLLGPSGCGKSTTLRMIAGVERPDAGRIRLDGREVCGPAGFVPPERRPVGLMFQDFALFPHLDIARNVAFGLRGQPRAEQARRVATLLERVGLASHAARFPHELSGGEQQRVALARALAPSPRLMLMDEPFSGLDDRLRDGVRDATLGLLQAGGTAVLLVTHDPGEAMRVADRIALMRGGRIVQAGSPRALYDHPVDRAAAEFFSDVNVFSGTVAGGEVETVLGRFPAPLLAEGVRAEVVVRPQHMELATDADAPGVPARLHRLRFVGRESLLDLTIGEGTPVRAVLGGFEPSEPGTCFRVRVARERAFVFAASS